jgi:reactive intermediate/imine deaminase
MRHAINTKDAPAAIGSYSQAIKAGNTIYLSGQIPLDPTTNALVEGDISVQVTRVFDNMKAVATAAGGSLDDVMKITVYLVDLPNITVINEMMAKYFKTPFPARTTIEVSALPKGSAVEVEAIMVLHSPTP